MKLGLEMIDCFRDLLVFCYELGKVEAAHMYDDYFCSVEGVGKGGHKFTLSLRVEQEPVCENNNVEENEND